MIALFMTDLPQLNPKDDAVQDEQLTAASASSAQVKPESLSVSPAVEADAEALAQTEVDALEQATTSPGEGHHDDSTSATWLDHVGSAWHDATHRFSQLLPSLPLPSLPTLPSLPSLPTLPSLPRQLTRWFSVSETEVVEILAAVRSQLPTTEALLIGKPQSGKSSIVRGLTGVSADIVGQGFRPHTQHTERYTYPTADLPLLIFTDTVGLGDIHQDTQAIIDDLAAELDQDTTRARILILTVKINDFAVDSLRQTAQQLRKRYPTVPCLLAITCLHELYPGSAADHPEYPPDMETVVRSATALQSSFAGLCDRSVLIDFTLEEDGYTPVFYGLDALRDALAELLPEAEARAMHHLLNDSTGQQLGDLYRDVGRRYMLAFSTAAATLAAVPLPFATMPVLTALQVSMVGLLARLYHQPISTAQAGGIVSAIAGGFLAQAVGRELIKFIPGFGSIIAASWAAAYTWALGEATCVYFGDLMGGKKPDPQRIQAVMDEAFQAAKQRFKGIQS